MWNFMLDNLFILIYLSLSAKFVVASLNMSLKAVHCEIRLYYAGGLQVDWFFNLEIQDSKESRISSTKC